MNCWEFMGCGRNEGGSRVLDLGVCPAAVEKRLEGIHGGNNAGRACWVIAGTLCGGEVQGTFAKKCVTCIECDFYKFVSTEEGKGFMPPLVLQNMLGGHNRKFP